MKRVLLFSLSFIFIISEFIFAGWSTPIRVNQRIGGLQASRDSDTPWSMAADDSGNVHIVFESQDDDSCSLGIHYMERSYNGTWNNEMMVTNTEPMRNQPINHRSFGHPSILIDNNFRGFISYCMDTENDTFAEMRTQRVNLNDPQNIFRNYDYLSNYGGPNIRSAGVSGGRKVPVLTQDSSGVIYGFWPYCFLNGGGYLYKIYYNTCVDSTWGTETPSTIFTDSTYTMSMLNTKTDPVGDVHLLMTVKSSSSSPSYEVYWSYYDVSTSTWQLPTLISEVSSPDGNTSQYAYGLFSGTPSRFYYHVVWEEDSGTNTKVAYYRRYDSYTSSWGNIYIIDSTNAEKPCVAVDSYNKVHVVWEDDYGSTRWLFHKSFNYNGSPSTSYDMISYNSNLDSLTIPVVVADKWDNLHVTGVAHDNSLSDSIYEVFYSMNNAAPHRPLNLHQVSGYSYVHLYWSKNKEPDIHHYKITRKYKTNTQTYDNITDTAWVDTSVPEYDLESNTFVYYWLYAVDSASQGSPASETLAVYVPKNFSLPKVFADGELPSKIELSPSSPNPFNSSTEIKYALPYECPVSICVFDILGRKIKTLVNENQQPGYKSVIWDGRNGNGAMASSGIYLYRLSIADMVITKQMTLLK
jgi:hypothetical protein